MNCEKCTTLTKKNGYINPDTFPDDLKREHDKGHPNWKSLGKVTVTEYASIEGLGMEITG